MECAQIYMPQVQAVPFLPLETSSCSSKQLDVCLEAGPVLILLHIELVL